jgi:hypothetical protein
MKINKILSISLLVFVFCTTPALALTAVESASPSVEGASSAPASSAPASSAPASNPQTNPSLTQSTPPTPSFPDVPATSAHFGAIEYLKAKGVVSGYDDSTFRPDRTINRAEALKIVLLASGKAGDSQILLRFNDVNKNAWFYQYAAKGYELGIIKGYDDGSFKPGNNINVAESLKVILLAFGESVPTGVDQGPYPDVGTDAWYAPYAAICKSKQLVWPLDDGKLHGERQITRGEFAQIIYRLMYVKDNHLDKFPMSKDWPTFAHPSDHYVLKYPFDWQVVPAGQQTVLWKQDTAAGQLSFARIYPNGATLTVVVDKNENATAFDAYLNALPYYAEGVTQKMTLNNLPFAVITFKNLNRIDYYFELPNKTFLVIYCDTGSGPNREYLLEEIRYIIGSVRYSEKASVLDRDTLLSQVRAQILVKESGKSALNLFKDAILIETDTIGIGTGPIDYYYSAAYEVTLKYERNSNTLLQIKDGRSTAF